MNGRLVPILVFAACAAPALADDQPATDGIEGETPSTRLCLQPVVVKELVGSTPRAVTSQTPTRVTQPSKAITVAKRLAQSWQTDESAPLIRLAQATDEPELPGAAELPDGPSLDVPDSEIFELIAPGPEEFDLESTSDDELPLPQIPDTRVVAPRTIDGSRIAPGNAPILAPAQSYPSTDPSLFPGPSGGPSAGPPRPGEVSTRFRISSSNRQRRVMVFRESPFGVRLKSSIDKTRS